MDSDSGDLEWIYPIHCQLFACISNGLLSRGHHDPQQFVDQSVLICFALPVLQDTEPTDSLTRQTAYPPGTTVYRLPFHRPMPTASSPSGLDALLQSYGRAPLLPHNRQLMLARSVRAWLDHPDGPDNAPPDIKRRGLRARDRLIECNLRLVVAVAKKWKRGLDQDQYQDLIQHGVLGLNRAIEKFDPSRGYQFSTYAYFWIEQSCRRHRATDGLLSISTTLHDRHTKLSKLVSQYEAEHGVRPAVAWLMQEANLSRKQVEDAIIIGKIRAVSSLNAHAGADNEGSEYIDLIHDQHTPSGLDTIAEEDLHQARVEAFHALLATLEKKAEQIALQSHLDRVPIADISARLGVSRSRVGQLKQAAVRQIRSIAADHPQYQLLLAA
jgi:RNA polymerase sigma factor (sigma-70 family)